jgi:hypothetical protein
VPDPSTIPSGAPPIPLVGWDDRRSPDRRSCPTPAFSWHVWFGGRRLGPRRRADDPYGFADQHGWSLFLVVTAVAALNIVDAYFTVLFLSHGGVELNPLIDFVLTQGTWPFLLVKSLGIGVCLVFLTLTKSFRASRIGLGVVLVGYLLLLCWHLYLLGEIPE